MIEIRSLRDLLRLLFIYQREFKLAALSAVVIIVLGAFLLPAKYESNARLLVKPGRDSTLPIEISNRQALVMPSTQRDPIVDEERLLTGRPIVRQVAERYLEVLANRPPPEGLWKRTKFYVKKAIGAVFDGIRVTLETFGVIEETTAVERLAKDLEKKFEVTHAAGSTVMEISFTWSEPEVAQEVVKAWIEIYMEERTQALGRKSLYAFYEAQTADSAAQIKSYKAQILKHLNEIGASSIEDRLQDLSERINVLRGERFNSIRLIASSDSALESTRQQLKGLPREIVTVRQIALNPAQQDLRRLLNQKRLERADMMRTYTDDAPPVKALDASIRALEKEVQDEGATVQSSEDRAPNTLTTHLERVLLDETSNNAALRTQLAEQEKQLAELEAQRREALDIEPTLARLQRELNATERNYALYVDSLEKSRIDRELDKSQISNISVIEEATYNPGRIFPKTLLMLFLAVPFGLAVGLLVVYLCYLLDQRIHDGGLVEEKFGLEALSSRMGSPWMHPNATGGIMALLLPLAFCYGVANQGWRRGLGLAVAVLGAAAILLASSRGAMLSLAVVLFWMSLRKVPYTGRLLLLGVGLVVVLVLSYPPLQERLATIFSPQNASTEVRFDEYRMFPKAVARYPLGIGFKVDPPVPGTDLLGISNLWLNFMYKVGLGGMLLFIAVTWRWWREARPEKGPIRLTRDNAIWLGSTGGILAALVSGLFDHYFSFAVVMIGLFWLLVGINLLEARRLFPERQPQPRAVGYRKLKRQLERGAEA